MTRWGLLSRIESITRDTNISVAGWGYGRRCDLGISLIARVAHDSWKRSCASVVITLKCPCDAAANWSTLTQVCTSGPLAMIGIGIERICGRTISGRVPPLDPVYCYSLLANYRFTTFPPSSSFIVVRINGFVGVYVASLIVVRINGFVGVYVASLVVVRIDGLGNSLGNGSMRPSNAACTKFKIILSAEALSASVSLGHCLRERSNPNRLGIWRSPHLRRERSYSYCLGIWRRPHLRRKRSDPNRIFNFVLHFVNGCSGFLDLNRPLAPASRQSPVVPDRTSNTWMGRVLSVCYATLTRSGHLGGRAVGRAVGAGINDLPLFAVCRHRCGPAAFLYEIKSIMAAWGCCVGLGSRVDGLARGALRFTFGCYRRCRRWSATSVIC